MERKAAPERLSGIPANENIIIAASGRFVGEGFDEPRLAYSIPIAYFFLFLILIL